MVKQRVSSALKSVDLKQEVGPLLIGERINTQGSKKAKQLVMNDDFDGLIELARNQVDDGAHCLDVCVATTERSDEKEFMLKLAKHLSLEIDAPLVIDSTDPSVIEKAIEQIPGKPIINSINLEGDGSRFKSLAPIMAKYGIPAIALCIGPNGMAKTPEQKLETAELLYESGKKYGLKIEQFIFDVLTFTLATGEEEFQNAGKNTLDGIRLVKERFPNSFTTLGLSNISFGLSPQSRRVVNSVFLYHAVKAGLDSAIVNVKEITPYTDIDENEKKLVENLIFNKNPDALSELITHFEKISSGSVKSEKKTDIDPSWSAGKKANFRIVSRLKDGIENDVVSAIAEKISVNVVDSNGKLSLNAEKEVTHPGAIQTLNEDLLPAMKEVGDKFGSGELILPFVLKSAECMKAAVKELENYLVKEEGTSKGKLVLGTVYGDVHDIGKNLVKTIFVNNGYEVYDLGKQVPLQKFVEKIDEVKPDAIGLSALLVSTSKQMQYFVEHSRKTNADIPILCGGAAINTNFINRIAKEGGIYNPGVFYCNTMFEGLKTMDKIVSNERERFVEEWKNNIEKWEDKVVDNKEQIEKLPRSEIKPVKPPVPPTINQTIVINPEEIDLNEIWKNLHKKSLFKLSWGIRGNSDVEAVIDQEKLLEEWKKRVVDDNLFEPKAVYGYFKCRCDDNNLVVENLDGEKLIFDFPRSSKSKHLCLSDYFGNDDVVAFQVVTVGNKVAETIEKWNNEDKYTDAYYLHGLAVETAEAMAEWLNLKIKNELNLKNNAGLRYSWGYPSCPDISQHHLVWKLLHPENLGLTLTEVGQIIPEQSTAAIIIHHPDAEYFVL
jgi:5-methyltetrahydrofolate--homocysteine methyltransferase|tara:strand:- start:66 stop:2564 length:2499 start_codon:yes stop_codon:yes gene_type:complete